MERRGGGGKGRKEEERGGRTGGREREGRGGGKERGEGRRERERGEGGRERGGKEGEREGREGGEREGREGKMEHVNNGHISGSPCTVHIFLYDKKEMLMSRKGEKYMHMYREEGGRRGRKGEREEERIYSVREHVYQHQQVSS